MIRSRCGVVCWNVLVCSLVASVCGFSAVAQVPNGSETGRPGAAAPAGAVAGSGSRVEFAAVSVRPSSRKFFLKGWDFLDPLSKMPTAQGGYFSWNVPLSYLVNFAYDLSSTPLQKQAWTALPKWAQEDWYSVEARADGSPTREDVRAMVRSMLKERFQFAGHVERREGDVLALEVVKPGMGLKPHAEGTPCTLPAEVMDPKKYPQAYPAYAGFAPRCGVFNRELSHAGERRYEMLNVTMQQIGDALMLPQPVLDHTSLAGHYDAVLDFGPEMIRENVDPANVLGLPPLPVALQKQLGLKLEKQRAQIDVFVMDSIAPLSEN